MTKEKVDKAVEEFFDHRYLNGHDPFSKDGLTNKSKATDRLLDRIAEKTYDEWLSDKE